MAAAGHRSQGLLLCQVPAPRRPPPWLLPDVRRAGEVVFVELLILWAVVFFIGILIGARL